MTARERVVFTNRSKVPVNELIFHVYPRYKVPEKDRIKLAKTMEVLRLSPEEAMDAAGQRMEVSRVFVGNRATRFEFDPKDDTILVVPLATAVPPGGKVVAVIDFTVDLPEKWGRWGNHQGITYLLNWYPVLAHHDDRGWERTPFVPWHQPWHQEAGHYTVVADLPAGQVVASSGRITRRQDGPGGWQRLTIEASPARDFALVCSDRFQTWERQVGSTDGPGSRLPRACRQRPASPRLCLRGHPALRDSGSGPTSTPSSRSPPRSSAGTATSARGWSCSTTG